MRKIEKQIIDIIIDGQMGICRKRLSCRDEIVRDDDGWYHVILFGTDICKISPWCSKMCITMHGYGTPTTMSRIRALLDAFQDGFTLTRDYLHRYDEWSERQQRDISRGEPLLYSASGQRAHIRDTEVLVFSDRIQYWDDQHKIWEDYPALYEE